MKFSVYDDDGSGGKDSIGDFETTLGAICGAQNQTVIADIKKSGSSTSNGKIIIRVDAIKESNEIVTF